MSMILSNPLISKTSRMGLDGEQSANFAERRDRALAVSSTARSPCTADIRKISQVHDDSGVAVIDGATQTLFKVAGIDTVDAARRLRNQRAALPFDIEFHARSPTYRNETRTIPPCKGCCLATSRAPGNIRAAPFGGPTRIRTWDRWIRESRGFPRARTISSPAADADQFRQPPLGRGTLKPVIKGTRRGGRHASPQVVSAPSGGVPPAWLRVAGASRLKRRT